MATALRSLFTASSYAPHSPRCRTVSSAARPTRQKAEPRRSRNWSRLRGGGRLGRYHWSKCRHVREFRGPAERPVSVSDCAGLPALFPWMPSRSRRTSAPVDLVERCAARSAARPQEGLNLGREPMTPGKKRQDASFEQPRKPLCAQRRAGGRSRGARKRRVRQEGGADGSRRRGAQARADETSARAERSIHESGSLIGPSESISYHPAPTRPHPRTDKTSAGVRQLAQKGIEHDGFGCFFRVAVAAGGDSRR